MNNKAQGLNGILAQVKAMPPVRVIILGVILCLVLIFSVWQRKIAGLTRSVESLRVNEIPQEDVVLLELANKKIDANITEEKVRLKKKREDVVSIASANDISVSPNVYAEVVAALNKLLDNNNLKLVKYIEKYGNEVNELSPYVSQFSQRYLVMGDFTDMLDFLEQVNQLPYLFQVTVLDIKSIDMDYMHTLDKRLVIMDFSLILYYLQALEQ